MLTTFDKGETKEKELLLKELRTCSESEGFFCNQPDAAEMDYNYKRLAEYYNGAAVTDQSCDEFPTCKNLVSQVDPSLFGESRLFK